VNLIFANGCMASPALIREALRNIEPPSEAATSMEQVEAWDLIAVPVLVRDTVRTITTHIVPPPVKRTLAGIPLRIDPQMPKHRIEFRNASGAVLARIDGLGFPTKL
jgi:hypothetical protein